MKKRQIKITRNYFTEAEKHQMIKEYISTGSSKAEIWKKYTGNEDHGRLLTWMRKLGYETGLKTKFVSNLSLMPRKKNKLFTEEESFETLQLKNRIAELEKQLKEAELKAIAFSTMVDIAEKEFKIPIRKKFNTKP